MNCIVVDDDPFIRGDMEQKISNVPFLVFEKGCSSAMEASTFLLSNKVDLIFLDVNMPEMNGLQFIKSMDTERPQIILITSEKEFAADAFEYEVTDFLLKPVSNERFLKAVLKAQKIYQSKSEITFSDDYVFIKVNSRLVKVNIKDILYVEALADYVVVHVPDNKYIVHSTMKGVESFLPPNDFIRVHNSFIIRIDKISTIEDNSVIINKKLIPVSRSKIKSLMARLKTL